MKVIIIGAGEVGFHLASRFAHENKDVVVIDNDPEALGRVSEHLDVQGILGSGASPVSLKAAGIKETEILLAVTNSDEVNLVACMAADIISPTTRKLARIRHVDFDDYHHTLKEAAPHIDTVINPEIEVVKSIERLMNVPGAVDVSEFADGHFKFIGIRLEQSADQCGKRLIDIAAEAGEACPLISAIIRNDELIIPRGKDRLLPHDLVYFISKADDYLDALAFFGKQGEPPKRVLVVGGGRIGMRLALRMEEAGIQLKIIEKNSDRCLVLAEELNQSVVLHGDGSDQQLLQEENVQDMDVVVTLTNDDENNILTSLLAKRLGAPRTITRISRFSYFPLMTTIGIEQVVSPRVSAINTILQYIRQGKVISAQAIKGESAEVLEAEALETSDIVGKPLKKLRFPKDTLIIGIMHGEEIIIPSGESVVHPGDRVIIFAHRNAIPKVEKMLAVKLEFF